MLTLKNFEHQVSENILSRGRKCYEDGAVSTIEQAEENRWEAEVDGSETYSVEVTLKKDHVVSEHSCNCPYDGGICKHVVAVLFAIQEKAKDSKYKKTSTSKKAVFEKLVKKISLKEYQEFILHYASKNKNFVTEFELWFADKDESIDVGKSYADLVKKLIKKHTSQNYVDYGDSFRLSKEIGKLLDTGFEFVKKKNYKDAFALAKAVLTEIIGVIAYCDDSNGDIGGTIDDAIELINAIGNDNEAAMQLKEQVFDFVQTELDNEDYFDYGDFGYNLFAVFQNLAGKLNKAAEFFRFVDTQLSNLTAENDNYWKKFFLTQKINFLKTMGRTAEVEKLIRENMDIVEVRQEQVNKAVDSKDFVSAKKLIQEGIKIAKRKKHPGTVLAWEKELLRIAVLEKDKETVKHYSKQFAFDYGFDKQYYLQWKKTYPDTEWKEVIEEYIKDTHEKVIKEQKRNKDKERWYLPDSDLFSSLAAVYIQEKYWDRLLSLVRTEPSLEIILLYHDSLVKIYPSELLELYLPAFERKGETANSRTEYAELAHKMKKVAKNIPQGKQKITALAQLLMKKFPRRSAMIEELNKIL